jgi:TusA-related sulfurtransferase
MKNIMLNFPLDQECLRLPAQVKVDRTLDCLGLFCPEPVFRVRMELDNMKTGEILEVLADDPAAEEDIKSLCKRLEQELLSLSKEDSTLRFLIKKAK